LIQSRDADRWLSLGEASALLGVHTSTLRRWADSGRVSCRRTAGGHRRFSMRTLRPLIREDTSAAATNRYELGPVEDQRWHARFLEAGVIDAVRTLGQRLGGILVQFLLRGEDEARHLAEGRSLGQEYASQSRAAGVDLVEAVEAFLFYRASFADVMGQTQGVETPALTVYARYDAFMSEVLLGLITGFTSTEDGVS